MNQSKKGFSLIEIIISIALFTVVMVAALGALFMVINANKEAKAIKLVVNNINLAVESMSRDLRVGADFCDYESDLDDGTCDYNDGAGVSDQIWFTTDQDETLSSFRLSSSAIQRRISSTGDFEFLTGSDVIIDTLSFYPQGTLSGDSIQPFVTIVVGGHIDISGSTRDFNLQTTVSQRKIAP